MCASERRLHDGAFLGPGAANDLLASAEAAIRDVDDAARAVCVEHGEAALEVAGLEAVFGAQETQHLAARDAERVVEPLELARAAFGIELGDEHLVERRRLLERARARRFELLRILAREQDARRAHAFVRGAGCARGARQRRAPCTVLGGPSPRSLGQVTFVVGIRRRRRVRRVEHRIDVDELERARHEVVLGIEGGGREPDARRSGR